MIDRNFTKALPVLFGFFVMGFCDVVGIATSYIKNDFSLSETVAGFIPSMVFIWFLLISIPSAMAMNRSGREKNSAGEQHYNPRGNADSFFPL